MTDDIMRRWYADITSKAVSESCELGAAITAAILVEQQACAEYERCRDELDKLIERIPSGKMGRQTRRRR